MAGLRETLNKMPWLGWALALVMFGVSLFLFWRLSGGGDPYSVERLTEDVTIKCVETGEEWTMKRGQVEATLRQRAGLLDVEQGIENPSTGRPTGFPFSKGEWQTTIERINEEKRRVMERAG